LTFWQLCCLAEGHGRDRWARSSLLCALIVNAHRDPKKGRAAKPEDFSPFGRELLEALRPILVLIVGALIELFAKRSRSTAVDGEPDRGTRDRLRAKVREHWDTKP